MQQQQRLLHLIRFRADEAVNHEYKFPPLISSGKVHCCGWMAGWLAGWIAACQEKIMKELESYIRSKAVPSYQRNVDGV